MPDPLENICERLCLGGVGRTEADIQSDVRKFLLDADLDLGDQDLFEVSLEAQVGAGKRIDVQVGTTVIEVKKSIDSPAIRDAAKDQLAGYVRQRTLEEEQRFVGILTDGRVWLLYHLRLDGNLGLVSEFRVISRDSADGLSAWLEAVMATTSQLTPTPTRILRLLGEGSPTFAVDRADLQDLYSTLRDDPEVQLKRELWGRLLTAALGTHFKASDELFVEHTYLVLTAELIAHSVAGVEIDVPGSDVRGLLEGRQFTDAGIRGVVEADFFDWPALLPRGELLVRAIARRLNGFDWSKVEHDVLKVIYESVIDAATRHELGEYYTPDWLADKMVGELVTNPLEDRVLDPSCGSGTFLFWAVRRCLASADEAGMSNREALDLVVSRVAGIDLHPVAVTLARVTYLLAIGRERLSDRGALTIPVYLGDSVRWDQDDSLLQQGGITVHTSDGMELFSQDLHFPDGVLEDPLKFDRLVTSLANRAGDDARATIEGPVRKDGKRSTRPQKVPDISALLDEHDVSDSDRAPVTLVFEKLCRLYDEGRDHIWSYYIRNLARPLSFTRDGAQADVLVGNPPWLAYRYMPSSIKQSYERLSKARGLWAGGKNATHQDLSDLFVVRAVEQYLAPGGRFSFVMPFAVLSRRQYGGFRAGNYASQGAGVTQVRFDTPDDLSAIEPAIFPVPASVVTGIKAAPVEELPSETIAWSGHIDGAHHSWASVRAGLSRSEARVQRVGDGTALSPYKSSFRQGATLVPRVLVAVSIEDSGPLGIQSGRLRVRSARSTLEKAPWKDLPDQTGVIEEEFVREFLAGSRIVPYRALTPEFVAIPVISGEVVDGSDLRLDRYPGMAEWWRRAEALWTSNRSASSKLSLRDRIDYHRSLAQQLSESQERVVFTTSGTNLAACRVVDPGVVIDASLYWAPVNSPAEGRFLEAILNSDELRRRVKPLQALGQFGPRHFHLLPFEIGIPAFDMEDSAHVVLSGLAEKAEIAVAALSVDESVSFRKARKLVREHLEMSGLANKLNQAVSDVIR